MEAEGAESADYKGRSAACNSIVLPTALGGYQKYYVALRGFFVRNRSAVSQPNCGYNIVKSCW